MASELSHPRVVDEVTVRLVAAQVVVVTVLAVATGWLWLFGLLAVDFALRVAFGPRSPLAYLARRVLRPRIAVAQRPVPGPPKRFAATLGAVMSSLVVVFAYGTGWTAAAWVLAAAMVVFPFLEAAFGLCIGCQVFALLMRVGAVPRAVCEECADISRRRPSTLEA